MFPELSIPNAFLVQSMTLRYSEKYITEINVLITDDIAISKYLTH